LPLQTKQTKIKLKKNILPDRGGVGLVGARAHAPTPQLRLHSSTATTPQLELPLHKSSSGDGMRGGGVRRW
jgi:hypothetical protein